MSIFLNGLNLLIIYFISYQFNVILVKQYYSISRFLKVILSFYKYFIVIVSIQILTILIKSDILYLISNLLISIIVVILIDKNKIKVSRRSLLQIILSMIILFLLFYLFEFFCSFSIFLLVITTITAFLILLPFEEIIKKYYLNKAKIKLKSFKNMKIIGITGSFGKTSLKYYLKTALEKDFKIAYSPSNVNTLMGITKYINNSLEESDFLILELGIDKKNQMDKFKKLLSLDYAFVTSIGNMHLATFKNIDNLLKEKLKISMMLKKEGKLFINNDSQYLNKIEGNNIIKFSKKNVNVKSFDIEGMKIIDNKKIYNFPIHQSFFASYLDGIIKFFNELSLDKSKIFYQSNCFVDFDRRNKVFKKENGYLIDNSYNANLKGIEESLKLLKTLDGESYIILGGIIEQGKNYKVENSKLKVKLSGENVIFVGNKNHPLIENHQFKKLYITKSVNEAYKLIREINPNNVLLLCKGDNIYLR